MFTCLLHIRMKERRQDAKLSQQVVAERCGMSRSRYSLIECGHRVPSPKEMERISETLDLGNVFVPPRGAIKRLLSIGVNRYSKCPPYFPNQDRETHLSYANSLQEHWGLVKTFETQIRKRDDSPLCEYFCHLIGCDSRLKAMHLLLLLGRGAKPALFAPSAFGHTRRPIVSCDGRSEVGYRARPCLVLNDTWYFPQVSFKASRVIRVDMLIWDGSWRVLEINGARLRPNQDALRAMELELPILFVTEAQLVEQMEREFVLKKCA